MQRIFSYAGGLYGIFTVRNAAESKKLQEKLHRVFHQYGFEDIETPTFEYFEVFSKEVGTIPSRELYKFLTEKAIPLFFDLTLHRPFPEPVLPILP